MSHYRVAGLSRFLKLGECVGVDVGDRVQIGEVVRIDDASATLKPFDARSDATIGARAYRADNLSLSPHRSWKGRVVDALGRPIDGAGELVSGDRVGAARRRPSSSAQARARSRAPPNRGAGRRSLHAALPGAESRRVRGLRHRQIVASGDAGSRDADRHRRHRAGRRARPRSARISSTTRSARTPRPRSRSFRPATRAP